MTVAVLPMPPPIVSAPAASTLSTSSTSPAALLLSFHPHHRPLAVIIGATRLASTRASLFLQAGQEVLIIDDRSDAASSVPIDLRARADRAELALEHHPEGWQVVLDKRRDEIGLVCVVDSGQYSSSLQRALSQCRTAALLQAAAFVDSLEGCAY